LENITETHIVYYCALSMSNLTPRPPHPPPASPAVARVLPMVPEPSLFLEERQRFQSPDLPLAFMESPFRPQITPSAQSNFYSQEMAQPHKFPQMTVASPPLRQRPPSPAPQLARPSQPKPYPSEATLFLNGSITSEIQSRKVQFFTPPDPGPDVHSSALANQQSQADQLQSMRTPQLQHTPQSLPTAAPGSIPPDIMAVLSWQNDQLSKLQEQVARLLSASPLTPEQGRSCQTDSETSPALKQTQSVSTNTSSHWQLNQQDNQNLTHSPQLERTIDLPDYPTSPSASPVQAPDNGGINTLTSPVLGESVSMYEQSGIGSEPKVEELFENILGKVNRLLNQEQSETDSIGEKEKVDSRNYQLRNRMHINSQHVSDKQSDSVRDYPLVASAQAEKNAFNAVGAPSDDGLRMKNVPVTCTPSRDVLRRDTFSNQMPQAYKAPNQDESSKTVPINNYKEATFERLKQLGVSFISPAEFGPTSLPQAYVPNPSPDSSLNMNSLAMRHLSDKQLAQLAAQHRPIEHSFATNEFLAKYGMAEGRPRQDVVNQNHELNPVIHHQTSPQIQRVTSGPHPDLSNRVLDITAIMKQPKLL